MLGPIFGLVLIIGANAAFSANPSKTANNFRLVMGGATRFAGQLYDDYDGRQNVVFITAAGIGNPVALRSLRLFAKANIYASIFSVSIEMPYYFD